MAVEVIMPKFGLTMHEGTIQRWLKSEGEEVHAGEPLFEVETEKVLYEVESPATGVLARILYPADSTVPIATVIGVITEPGEDPARVAARYRTPGSLESPAAASRKSERPTAALRGQVRSRATPAARKLAEKLGIDLSGVAGSGPGGRITRQDVEGEASRVPPGGRSQPLTSMRKTIGKRLLTSLQESAQLTLTSEVDVTPMVERRAAMKAEVTFTDLIAQATARALLKHPILNSRLEGDRIVLLPQINMGLAVAIDDGLLVPVIRQVERKGIEEIARARIELVEKAKGRALSAEELSGATFTITNLGSYGIDGFTPIVQMPQVAILGVGRIVAKPMFHNGGIVNRQMMWLSLSFDHRVVDGAPAGAFLQTLSKFLQE